MHGTATDNIQRHVAITHKPRDIKKESRVWNGNVDHNDSTDLAHYATTIFSPFLRGAQTSREPACVENLSRTHPSPDVQFAGERKLVVLGFMDAGG